LNARNSLAAAYLAESRVAEAIPLFERTLAVQQRLLGPDHPDALTAQNNLAAAYQDAGRVADAILLYELTLAAREQLLGFDHPNTLNSRGNLAAAYRAGGRVAEAIALLEQTLADRERVLGPEHPDTRTSRKNLAAHKGEDPEDQAEAIPLFEPTSFSWPQILRPEHTDTQPAQKNLANAYWDGGQVAEDIPSVEEVPAVRESHAAVDDATMVLPAVFRRPPAESARRMLPVSFHWPSGDPVRRPIPDGVVRRSAQLTGYSPSSRARRAIDREVAAAIATGDPAGIALAYDRHASSLYDYCHWLLHDPAGAAEAVRDTFVIAAVTLGDDFEAPELRPWLYGVARNECQRLLRAAERVHDGQAGPDPAAGVSGESAEAELRTMIGVVLARLKPHEREVIELSLGHDLYGSDLAQALGMSPRRAHALAARARARLEKSLGILLVVRTGREACPVLGELLADWDGQLTEQTRDLVGGHVEQCKTCAVHGPGALRPAALFGLLPQAPLPGGLREQVLSSCSSASEDAVEERQRVTRRAESTWFARFSRAFRTMSWNSIGASAGTVTAAVAVVVWAVAAVSVILLTIGHSGRAPARTAVRPSASSPAATATGAAAVAATSAAATPSPTASHRSAHVPPPVQPSASPSLRPSVPPSSSPKPSKSSSSSPKPSTSPSPSSSRPVSPSPSPASSSAKP
jgi:RNA polymerase sigma factor (sigma-70 family)